MVRAGQKSDLAKFPNGMSPQASRPIIETDYSRIPFVPPDVLFRLVVHTAPAGARGSSKNLNTILTGMPSFYMYIHDIYLGITIRRKCGVFSRLCRCESRGSQGQPCLPSCRVGVVAVLCPIFE